MNPLQDVFISYGRADSKHFAKHLNDRLVALGYTVWFDFEDIPLGVDYQKQIDDGIEKSDNFLFLISPHSVNSDYCRLEIELALKHHKRIIPLLHVETISRELWQQRNPQGTEEEWATYQAEGRHSSFTNMHPDISKINWVYVREGLEDFDESLNNLMELLARQRSYVHQHTMLLDSALTWERNQKQTRYLLIGTERQRAEAWLAQTFTEEQAPCIPTDLHCEFITESIKNANNLMTQVFLCHAEKDRELAEQVRRSLIRSGITTWTHHGDIQLGTDFHAAMDRGMEEADNVVFLMSSRSLASPYCQKELEHALSLNKRIIPMLAEAVELEQIPEALQTLQYIDLTDNLTDVDYLQDESVLLRILNQDAAYHHEHKVLLTKALKWERQQQNPCILLRGYELQHAEAWLQVSQRYPDYGPLLLQQDFIAASQQQPPGITLDVFISYSRADSDFARKLNDGLQRQGKRTWFDQESIASGADFQQEIYKGIEASDHFLFILSPNAVCSPYCADEVEYAAKLNKRILTVRHRAVEATDLHPELAKVQWIDFQQNNADFAANFQELLRTLNVDPEHLRFHTRLLMQAIDWEEKGKRESLLLRGDELSDAEQWLLKATGKQPSPTELQGEYVAASRSAIEAAQIFAARRQRMVIGGLASLLAIAVAGAGFGFWKTDVANKALANAIEARDAEKQQRDLASEKQKEAEEAQKEAENAQDEAEKSRDQAQKSLKKARLAQAAEAKQSEVAEQKTAEAKAALAQSQAARAAEAEQKTIAEQKTADAEKALDQAKVAQAEAVTQRQRAEDAKKQAEANAVRARLGEQAAQARLRSYENPVEGIVMALQVAGESHTKLGRMLTAVQATLVDLLNIHTEFNVLNGHQKNVTSIAFSPDGYMLASGSEDHTVRLWDLDGNLIAPPLRGHTDYVNALAFSADGDYLVTASSDKTIRLWDLRDRHIPSKVFTGHQDVITAVAFSPDGTSILSGGYDGMKIWDLAGNGEDFSRLVGQRVNSVAFSPDGQTIVSASASTVQFWDRQRNFLGNPVNNAGEPIQELHAWAVNQVVFSPNGQYLATIGNDNFVKVLNVDSKKNHKTFPPAQVSAIRSVAFDPYSEHLAVALEKTIQIQDLDGRLINAQPLRGHQDNLTSISWHPMAPYLMATGSRDRTIRLWDVSQLATESVPSTHDETSALGLMARACDRLQFHPALLLEKHMADTIPASQTCRDHFWDATDNGYFLLRQGRKLAQEGNIQEAVATFREANALVSDLAIDPEAEAQRLAAWAQNEPVATVPDLDTLAEVPNSATYGQVSLSEFSLNTSGNTISVAPGEDIQVSTHYSYDCPECAGGAINQIIVGIAGENSAQACLYNGGAQGSGTAEFTLTAPEDPGVYDIRFRYAQTYGCEAGALGWWRVDGEPTADANIGAIVVTE